MLEVLRICHSPKKGYSSCGVLPYTELEQGFWLQNSYLPLRYWNPACAMLDFGV